MRNLAKNKNKSKTKSKGKKNNSTQKNKNKNKTKNNIYKNQLNDNEPTEKSLETNKSKNKNVVFCRRKTAPKINEILRKLQNFGKEKPKKKKLLPEKLRRDSIKDNEILKMIIKGEDDQFPTHNNDNNNNNDIIEEEDDKGINMSGDYSKYFEGDNANDMNYLDNAKIEDILNDNTNKKNNGRERVKKEIKEDMIQEI